MALLLLTLNLTIAKWKQLSQILHKCYLRLRKTVTLAKILKVINQQLQNQATIIPYTNKITKYLLIVILVRWQA